MTRERFCEIYPDLYNKPNIFYTFRRFVNGNIVPVEVYIESITWTLSLHDENQIIISEIKVHELDSDDTYEISLDDLYELEEINLLKKKIKELKLISLPNEVNILRSQLRLKERELKRLLKEKQKNE